MVSVSIFEMNHPEYFTLPPLLILVISANVVDGHFPMFEFFCTN
jgi:hypothetical protein